MSLALYSYRRGSYAEAVDWSRRCLAYPGSNAPRAATAHAIMAMSYHRLGRPDEAQAELIVAQDPVERRFKNNRVDRGDPVQGFWFDWIFARILVRESSALINSADLPRG